MAAFQIFKETALPGTLVANSIYLITHPTNTDYLEVYVTNNAGTATRRIPTEADIQALINSSLSALNAVDVVADIATRDALTPAQGDQAFVIDATGDPTVDSGGATYIYDGTAWVKISEAESMDVALDWNNIINGPTSSAGAIDAAVANSHTHANKTELDKIDEDVDGDPTYDGRNIVLRGGPPAW